MNLCFRKARFKLAIRNLTITVSVVDFQSLFISFLIVSLFILQYLYFVLSSTVLALCQCDLNIEYTHVTKENLYNKMYTLNSVFFSVSITFSSIHPLLFNETSSLSNYELPCTKEKDGKIRTFSLWTRDYFTCFDSGPPNSDG